MEELYTKSDHWSIRVILSSQADSCLSRVSDKFLHIPSTWFFELEILEIESGIF